MKLLKFLLLLIIGISFSILLKGQITEIFKPLPEYNMNDKIIKVRFVYILKELGTTGYPGNFTDSDDGGAGGSFNGETYVDAIVNRINNRLNNLVSSNLFPPSGSPPDNYVKAGFQFIAFHPSQYEKNNFYYYFDKDNSPGFASQEQAENMITVYLQADPDGDPTPAGYSLQVFSNGCYIQAAWQKYCLAVTGGYVDYHIKEYAVLILHEIGHCLGLAHAFCEQEGSELNPDPDPEMCDDLPTYDELELTHDEICEWNLPLNPNNIMSHGGNGFYESLCLTPCQLARIHYNLCITSHCNFWIHEGVTIEPSITLNPGNSSSLVNRPFPVLGNNIIAYGNLNLQAYKPTVFTATNKITLQTGFKVPKYGYFKAQWMNIDGTIKSLRNITEKSDQVFTFNCAIYPNPSNGSFTVQITEPAQITVYSVTGQKIYSLYLENEFSSIDLSGQSPGIYIFHFVTENESVSKRIIIE